MHTNSRERQLFTIASNNQDKAWFWQENGWMDDNG
jgi:hypothetical protein